MDTILNSIRTTTTKSGLHASADLTETEYQTGIKITAEQQAELKLTRQELFPRLNYSIAPNSSQKFAPMLARAPSTTASSPVRAKQSRYSERYGTGRPRAYTSVSICPLRTVNSE